MKSIISRRQLSGLRKKFKDKKIVLCSGSFDLVHAGHVIFFEDCKKFGDVLVVMVGPDNDIRKIKGADRPILAENIRAKTVASLKSVDFCFISEKAPGKGNQHRSLARAMAKLKPDVYVINDDAPQIPYRQKLCHRYNVKFIILKRHSPPEFGRISTTSIIDKIRG